MALKYSPYDIFPEVGINGRKVKLDLFTEADITPDYIAWLHDAEVVRFSNQRFRKHDVQNCRAYLASFTGSDNLFLSVKSLERNRPIGTMTAYVSRLHETADVGILIGDRNLWGHGMGQDAWTLLLDWLQQKLGVRKLTAGCAAGNLGMIRLMEHAGMHLEATLHGQEIIEGQPHDLVCYARFRNAESSSSKKT